jgi:hypothetical protein
MKQAFRYILNFIWLVAFLLLLLLGSVWFALQFPAVQTKITKEATRYLSDKLLFQTTVGRVNIKWFDAISLENVTIRDRDYRPMIKVERLDLNHNFLTLIATKTDFDFWGLVKKNKNNWGIQLDEATLYRPSVWLVSSKTTGKLNINDFIDRIFEMVGPPDSNQKPTPNAPFNIAKTRIIDGEFMMDYTQEPYMKSKEFDYNHFAIAAINGDAFNLNILGDTTAIDIVNLSGYDKKTKLTVKHLDTRFMICDTKIELANLYAKVGSSVIRNYLSFNYKTYDDFDDFNNRVVLKAHLDSSRVSSNDLGFFAQYLFTLNETWKASGDFEGVVQNFKVSNTDIAFGKKSRLRGNIAFKDVINYERMIMDFDLKNTHADAADIHRYYPEKSFIELMEKMGEMDFTGKYKGTIDRFKITKADFKSSTIGNVKGDLDMNLAVKTPTYNADIEATNFDLGKLIDEPDFTLTDFKGKIKGSGFSIKDASLDVENRLARFTYNGYEYRDIYLKGNLQNKFFDGQISVRDTNLQADLDGSFDFSGKQYVYNTQGKIERADLRALHFSTDSLVLHSDIDIDLVGNTADEIMGKARFYNSYSSIGKRNLVVDTLLIDSYFLNNERNLNIASEFLNFQSKGQFQPTKAVADIAQLFKEYQRYFTENENNRTVYYDKKKQLTPIKRYTIDYTVQFKKMARLLAFLYPDGYVSPNSTAAGTFTIDNTSMFSFGGQFDTLKIGTNAFYQSDIDLNTSKFTNSTEVLASAIVNSEKQQFGTLAPTEKLFFDGSWEKDHINFTSNLRQQKSTNRGNLNGALRFIGDQIQVQFERSKLKLLDEDWTLATNNLITVEGSHLSFSNVILSNQNQSIAIDGDVSTDSLQTLKLETRNVNLSTLNPIFKTNVSGILNGAVSLRDLYKKGIYESNIDISKLTYNNFVLGNITGKADWDGTQNNLKIDANLSHKNRDIVTINGIYDPIHQKQALNLKAKFNEADLEMIEPFARGFVSDLSGYVVGQVNISGPIESPILQGQLDVKRGKLTFDYLRASFAFEDKILIESENIRVQKLRLTDPEGNIATLNGGVYYDGFKNFWLNLDADMKNFKILNTTNRDNDLFYGTAFGTGKFGVSGPIDKLNITANLTSNRGTKIYIPLNSTNEVASDDFVQFVSTQVQADSALQIVKNETAALETEGMKMNIRINVTPEAECVINLNGDAVRAAGTGVMDFKYDTKGDFKMSGDYAIDRGDYTFTLQGLINKNFKIQPQSRIVWTGDPFGATLDMKASYTQNTSLLPILPQGAIVRDEIKTRRYPVEVTLLATGQIMTPQIGYDIKFKEYPSDFQLYIPSVEANLKRDDQFMAKQVSSMLLFSQLNPEGADFLTQSVGSGFSNSVSELVTNQVSKWASSISENLEVGLIGLDFAKLYNGSQSSTIWNDLQLRFSYRFLNDRFRITRDGRLSYGQNQTDATATNLLSDWTLEYWLTSDGSQRVKMYSRNNTQNQFALTSSAVSYGASFTFSRSFNSFRLFGPKENRSGDIQKADAARLTSFRLEK